MARTNPTANPTGEAGRCPRARAMRAQKRGEVAQMAPTAVALVKVSATFSNKK